MAAAPPKYWQLLPSDFWIDSKVHIIVVGVGLKSSGTDPRTQIFGLGFDPRTSISYSGITSILVAICSSMQIDLPRQVPIKPRIHTGKKIIQVIPLQNKYQNPH